VVLASGRPDGEVYNIVNQMSFRVPDLAWLRALHAKLVKEPGITEILPATHGNAVSVYFRDPEGTRIECFIDTPWHSEQPCREPVDFAQSETEIMAQVERIARASKIFMPRDQWVAEMKRRMEAGIHA
jgi:catechol-2,3-dioxygenase